ncbi:MAG: hypothetical protein GXY67_13900 [Clostridiales bacterium]|nr:hypothetical protein [Clostridiales bacterium]
MTLNMPITKRAIKNHFHYSFWKYILLAILAIFGWNMLFTTTRYRVPDEKKMEFYADGSFSAQGTDAAMDVLLENIRQELMPQMEEMSFAPLTVDETYGDMQLFVWVGAGQGDVYLLNRERFKRLAAGGTFVDLQPYVDSGVLPVEDIDLTLGRVRNEDSGQSVLCGIPADSLIKLESCGIWPKNTVLAVLSSSKNETESVQFISYLLNNMQ